MSVEFEALKSKLAERRLSLEDVARLAYWDEISDFGCDEDTDEDDEVIDDKTRYENALAFIDSLDFEVIDTSTNGDGQEFEVIFKLDGVYVAQDWVYSSWGETGSESDCYQVFPKKRMITIYEATK